MLLVVVLLVLVLKVLLSLAVFPLIGAADSSKSSERRRELSPQPNQDYATGEVTQVAVVLRGDLSTSRSQPQSVMSKAAKWLESAGSAEVESFKSPGVGQDVRIRSPGLDGAMLAVEDQPIHLALFPAE